MPTPCWPTEHKHLLNRLQSVFPALIARQHPVSLISLARTLAFLCVSAMKLMCVISFLLSMPVAWVPMLQHHPQSLAHNCHSIYPQGVATWVI